MKNLVCSLGLILMLSVTAHAVDRGRNAGSVAPFTGENLSFAKVAVSSTTAATLGAYSSGRGALTCVNSDSTNTVYLGSSTAVTAGGAASLPLVKGQSIQILNIGALFGIADTGVSSVNVYCLTEY